MCIEDKFVGVYNTVTGLRFHTHFFENIWIQCELFVEFWFPFFFGTIRLKFTMKVLFHYDIIFILKVGIFVLIHLKSNEIPVCFFTQSEIITGIPVKSIRYIV